LQLTFDDRETAMTDKTATTWHLDDHDVAVSHLDKLYWPDDGLTKGDLLDYYRDLAPVMLPYFAGRPVTLRCFPEGIAAESFYQRDLPQRAPPWFRSVDYAVQSGARTIQLPLVDDAAGLVWLANEGCIELHLWSSRLPILSEPDQAVFDLDPGDDVTFDAVLLTALVLRDELARQRLRGYPKTSGRRGMHVHVPLAPGHHYPQVRAWVKAVAEQLEASHPGLIAVARGATHEGDRVTVDYAQNSIARTMAAPYTVRAVPAAAVAAPLSWDEVAAGAVRPADFTLRTMPARVREVGDLFAPVLEKGDRVMG
jgi:bifunctional non-homologous end joining protein LigD